MKCVISLPLVATKWIAQIINKSLGTLWNAKSSVSNELDTQNGSKQELKLFGHKHSAEESHTGLEKHEAEYDDNIFIFGWTIPLNILGLKAQLFGTRQMGSKCSPESFIITQIFHITFILYCSALLLSHTCNIVLLLPRPSRGTDARSRKRTLCSELSPPCRTRLII